VGRVRGDTVTFEPRTPRSSMLALTPPRILQATARNRVIVAYGVAPDRVAPLLPDGLVPVQRNDTAYVSLVGVELTKIRVLGLVPPGCRRVAAVELRVHARPAQNSSGTRGTWTVQAHVPRRLVAWSARVLYGESVAVTSMQPIRREQPDHVEVTYRYDWRGREQRIRVRGTAPPNTPPPTHSPPSCFVQTGASAPRAPAPFFGRALTAPSPPSMPYRRTT
jgi:uncharacterized protein YqjF (DUF2071 family)